MAPVKEGTGRCAHCGVGCRTRDASGVWHCGTEHLLLVRLGVPPITAAPAPTGPRRPPVTETSRYASLRATLAQEAVNQRHAAVLRLAARRVRLLRSHLEAGLELTAGNRREERVVRAVLVQPEVLDALGEIVTTLGGQPGTTAPPATEAPAHALALVRDLEDALAAAGAGRRDANAQARRAAVGLLGYVGSELRRCGPRPEAA